MHGKGRILVIVAILVCLHTLLSFTHVEYRRRTSIARLADSFRAAPVSAPPERNPVLDDYYPDEAIDGIPDPRVRRRANATLLMLARNSDRAGAARSVRRLEEQFNHNFSYPWVFLNDQPFDELFKAEIRALTSAPVSFGVIPRDDWVQPSWIDEERATRSREKMHDAEVVYGDSVSYRNMCRFHSGFFFNHELLLPYKWYWRVEPDVEFHCEIGFDPFWYMERHNKTYGFVIAPHEWQSTVATLWNTTKEFMRLNPQHVARDNALGFSSDDGGAEWNMCHFWSNFEIADMDFWRGPAYAAYFAHLDAAGGFYYERWGDAPVHSLAAALFLPRGALHFFDAIGYTHAPLMRCPQDKALRRRGRCDCGMQFSFDYMSHSCYRRWKKMDSAASVAVVPFPSL